jgi:HK97 family phage portal protein
MQSSVVNSCVRVRAESIASLPLVTMRELAPRKKVRAHEETLYRLLHDRPNPWQTSFEWREDMNRQFDTRGNAYSLIERDSRGAVQNLYPLRSDRVSIRKGDDLRPYYQCSELSGSPTLSRERIFHLRGMSKDGYTGLSPIQEAMEAVGLALATEQFGASLFGNGALQRGWFMYNGSLEPDEYAKVRKWIEEQHGGGMRNANRPGVLDGDWKWQSTSLNADEAQFLATRGFQVEDIARLYRMPLPMIGHSDKTATYASAEQFFLAFVVHCLKPLVDRWEQALRRDLLTEGELDLSPTFLLAGLLRGDIKTRFAAYAVARQWGWFNVDEIREFEDMNELPDGKGQTYLEPLNMIEAGSDREAANQTDAGKVMAALQTLGQFMANSAPGLETEESNA